MPFSTCSNILAYLCDKTVTVRGHSCDGGGGGAESDSARLSQKVINIFTLNYKLDRRIEVNAENNFTLVSLPLPPVHIG